MRIALITGGSGGLGLATARRLARDGMTVVIADVEEGSARQAAASLEVAEKVVGHRGIALDVTKELEVQAAFEALERGLGPVAVLACFAGILGTGKPGRTALLDMTVDEWERVNAVNSKGTFLCIREFARHRQQRPVAHGRVITVSSAAGQLGGLQSGVAYTASKSAVLGITKVCARELAPLGITVNAIAPGPIDTAMLRATVPESRRDGEQYGALASVPLGRIGMPDEIAAAAAYLASIDAGYVTGATLDVNGGLRMG